MNFKHLVVYGEGFGGKIKDINNRPKEEFVDFIDPYFYKLLNNSMNS